MSADASNTLWLIWRSKNPKNRRRYLIGTLSFDPSQNKYGFKYGYDYQLAREEGGLDFFPGFQKSDTEYTHSGALFPNIASRLPNKEREDYVAILNTYNIAPADDEFAILKKTKGRLITDNFEFVPVFDDTEPIIFDIAGLNHRDLEKISEYQRKGILIDNARLELRPKPNTHDQYAVEVYVINGSEEYFIGYVPRYYSKQLSELISTGAEYSALIDHVNLSAVIPDERISVRIRILFTESM